MKKILLLVFVSAFFSITSTTLANQVEVTAIAPEISSVLLNDKYSEILKNQKDEATKMGFLLKVENIVSLNIVSVVFVNVQLSYKNKNDLKSTWASYGEIGAALKQDSDGNWLVDSISYQAASK